MISAVRGPFSCFLSRLSPRKRERERESPSGHGLGPRGERVFYSHQRMTRERKKLLRGKRGLLMNIDDSYFNNVVQ